MKTKRSETRYDEQGEKSMECEITSESESVNRSMREAEILHSENEIEITESMVGAELRDPENEKFRYDD